MILIALFVAKLLSVTIAVLGLIAGSLSRTWWHAALAGLPVAYAHEALLHAVKYTHATTPLTFAIGYAAALAWILIGRWFKGVIQRRRTA